MRPEFLNRPFTCRENVQVRAFTEDHLWLSALELAKQVHAASKSHLSVLAQHGGGPVAPRLKLEGALDDFALDPGGLDTINRPEKEWPLARTQYQKLYLDASNGSLSRNAVAKVSQSSYPGETGKAEFVIRFDRETELTGYLKLKLWVEADGADDMDLFVYVQKLDSHGNWLPSLILNHEHPGAQGWLRVSHRELDPKRSTPAEPYHPHTRQQMLKPKEIVPVEIGIVPTGMRWHAGQQLRVVVGGHFMREPTWFEKFKYESRSPGTHIIHTGGQYDSHLLIPNIPL